MKKISLVLLCIICACAALAGCDTGDSDTPTPVEQAYQISGTKDHSISVGETGYDFLKGVYALADNGVVKEGVLCDTTAVDFEKSGEYPIIYSYAGVESIQKKVKVYGSPKIAVELGKEELSLDYKDINDINLIEGISAVDSFGQAVQVALVAENYPAAEGDGFMYCADGTPNYGTFITNIFAVDLLGNTAHYTRRITVVKNVETAPEFIRSDGVVADVVDEFISIEIDLKNEIFEAVSLYGVPLSFDVYKIEEGSLKLNLFAYDDSPELIEGKLRLVTSGGYSETNFRFVDEQEPQLDFYGMNNWIFKINEQSVLPRPQRLNSRQTFNLEYVLRDADGDIVEIDNGYSFIPEKIGEHTLVTKAVISGVTVGEELMLLNVLGAEEYSKVFNAANSLQHYGENIIKPSSTTSDTILRYTEGGIAESGAYLFKIPASPAESEWNHRVEFTGNSLHNKDNITGYHSWSIDMYMSKAASILFWDHADKLIRLMLSDNVAFKNSAGQDIFDIPINEWFTVEILINSANNPTDAVLLRMGSTTPSADIYFRNIILKTHDDMIKQPDFTPDFSGLDGWVYKKDTETSLPRVSNLAFGEHIYTFTQVPGGQPLVIDSSKQKYAFTQTGDYSYTLTVMWKGEKIAERQNLTLTVSEQLSEKDVINASTKQDLSKIFGEGIGTSIFFTEEDIGGETGVYRIRAVKGQPLWNTRADLTGVDSQTALRHYQWTIKMYLTGGAVPMFWSNDNTAYMESGESKIKIMDENAQLITVSGQSDVINKCQDKWLTISIYIGYNKNPPAVPFRIGVSEPGTGIYFKSLKLEEYTEYFYKFYSHGTGADTNLIFKDVEMSGEGGVTKLNTRTNGQAWENRYAIYSPTEYTSQFSKWSLTVYIDNGAWPILWINGTNIRIDLDRTNNADIITIKDKDGQIIPLGNAMNDYRLKWLTIEILIPETAGALDENLIIGNNAAYSNVFIKDIRPIK